MTDINDVLVSQNFSLLATELWQQFLAKSLQF